MSTEENKAKTEKTFICLVAETKIHGWACGQNTDRRSKVSVHRTRNRGDGVDARYHRSKSETGHVLRREDEIG